MHSLAKPPCSYILSKGIIALPRIKPSFHLAMHMASKMPLSIGINRYINRDRCT